MHLIARGRVLAPSIPLPGAGAELVRAPLSSRQLIKLIRSSRSARRRHVRALTPLAESSALQPGPGLAQLGAAGGAPPDPHTGPAHTEK